MIVKSSYKKPVRIFCGSPTDVSAERQILQEVVAALNRPGQAADNAGVILEVIDWQTHVSPDAGRPEGNLLKKFPPETWDIFLGMLWLKFGSPTGEKHPRSGASYESGTEEEFTLAYDLWKKNQQPRIWFYRCMRAADLDLINSTQFDKVKDFFAQCQAGANHELFYRTFKTADDFKDKVRDDLTEFLLNYQPAAAPPTAPAAAPQPSPAEIEALRRRYLQKLQTYCNLLPLAAIDEDHDRQSNTRLTLSQVYIRLNTTDEVDQNGQPLNRERAEMRAPQEKTRQLAVIEAAAQHETLVILGDPGSGKSSFVNHLMFTLADHLLNPANGLPELWPHGALLPVRVLLRELAVTLQNADATAWSNPSAEQCAREFCRLVHAHLAAHLTDFEAPDFAAALRQTLDERRGLIVFDGLDEVPARQRVLVKRCVEAFCAEARGNRFLITCRILSYQDDATKLAGAKAATLAPFAKEQIAAFIAYWYGALAQAQQFSAAAAKKKESDLLEATKGLPPSLVQNPLLLTTLAKLHSNNVELPRRRVTLYRDAAKLLLKRWQEHKAGKISLFEELGQQSDLMLNGALRELGYAAQRAERGSEAAAIAEDEAEKILKKNFAGVSDPRLAAGRFLGFVDETAGLLIARGGSGSRSNVYAFAHRTFQEYFAGCHLLKRRSREAVAELKKLLPEGDYWRLTARLGIEHLLYNDDNKDLPLDVAYELCPPQTPDFADVAAWRGIFWAALFALEIGPSYIAQDTASNGGKAFLARLQQRLVAILENGLLPARERAEAGFALGKLGDSRDGVCSLPPIWIDLPGGRFTMGDDENGPPHEVELSPFKMSKYPITNAQFAEFVQAGGYDHKNWWSEEGWEYRQKENWQQPHYWDHDDFNLPNQPVVGVSWFEAEAFCNWLSAEGIEQRAEGNQIIRLPMEAEWEFAARGSEGRKYPWGPEEPTVEHANYNELQLNRTTAVGSFPAGATLSSAARNSNATDDKIFDLAGNVWEWCGDWHSDKYYAECKKRGVIKNPCGPETGKYRILRGGGYYSDNSFLRGALRNYIDPSLRDFNGGVRVVCSAES